MLMLVVALFIYGLCLGSFVNALVWRIHQGRDFVKERSQCPLCGHQLAAKDLVPVLSWLYLSGRCRYCKKPIADSPLVELAAGLVFVLSYIYWPQPLHAGQIVLFISWLVCSVGLLALALYDIRWMLLPNKILYPTLVAAVMGNIVYILTLSRGSGRFIIDWALAVLVASGIFFILYLVSSGRWIGYGDVRLGLVTGSLLHKPSLSFLMIFIASLLGVLYSLPLLLQKQPKMGAKIPFGPFLIAGCFICLLWGSLAIDWYKNNLLL